MLLSSFTADFILCISRFLVLLLDTKFSISLLASYDFISYLLSSCFTKRIHVGTPLDVSPRCKRSRW
ncbi:hypothetical protein YC2023_033525 [Brassica napus]